MRIWSFVLIYTGACALQPSRLPNGQLLRFRSNVFASCLDLKAIESYESNIITNYWTENINVYQTGNREDKHILDHIDEFNRLFKNNPDPRYVHLIWVPPGMSQEILFYVLVRVDNITETLSVCMLIQSPFWDSTQIESIELKYALEDLAVKSKKVLDLTQLYDNDVRFRLAWNEW